MKKLILLPILITFIFAQEFKIVTYNVNNLFDDINNGTEYSDYIVGKHNWSSVTFRKKLANIAKVICELNADVVALQEVENENALKALQAYLNRSNCKYRYSAITHKRGSAIEIALLSKIALKHNRDVRVSYSASSRDILKVTLQTTPKITIYANHWRSKKAKESARLRAAMALVKDIKSLPKGREYIILGDFNSRYNECKHLRNKYNDTNGVCGIDSVLKTYINGKLNKLNSKIDAQFYHYNLWSEIIPYKRWSHNYYGSKSAIDSIIIPANMVDNKGWHYVKNSFGVFKKDYLFKGRGVLNIWEYKNGKHIGKGFSDHLPIYATFSNKEKKELKHEGVFNKFWKLFVPKVKEQKEKNFKNISNSSLKVLSLEELANVEALQSPIILKNVCVVFKRGGIGVLKSSKESKAIMLYKCAQDLKEGSCYDLKVYKKKRYFNLDEILDLEIIKKLSKVEVNSFILKFKLSMMSSDLGNIGDIVKDIEGVYNNGYLYINGKKVKLYLKTKAKRFLKNGANLYIKKAQIGYYKGEKELVVYSSNDIIKED